MGKKIFSGVQDTLFIPLAARIRVSQRFPEYFYDEASMRFKDLKQVKKVLQKSSEYSEIASAARYYNMDQFVRSFLKKHPDGMVVNLGAGLDTMNYRIHSLSTPFYSIDFPDVIQMREKLLGKSENETMIGCDLTNMSWAKTIDTEKPTIFIASGVFQYFKPEIVEILIQDLKAVFQNSELVFDATNEVGIHYAQRYVKKSGNKEAMMYFYVNDAEQFAKNQEVILLETRGFYDEARKIIGRKTGLYTRIAMKVADKKKRTLLLHLKLNEDIF